jgi:poly-beta-1,6-N-acetyl-D-glucosamine synthase
MRVLDSFDRPLYLILAIALLTVVLSIYFVYFEYKRAKFLRSHTPNKNYRFSKIRKTAILIASKDGEMTIYKTVKAAKQTRYPVYVVSDGSTDNTAGEAKKAGAIVMALDKNVGKPAALYAAYNHFKLGQSYDALAILDDDVMIEKSFVRETKKTMNRNVAIAVGKNLTDWPDHKRWNVWLATRTYSYWAYQITMRTVQSTYNIMTCISGSNSLYRTEVLDQVLNGKTPYIVDDTYWTLETHRLNLGEIKYSPKARAWLQDPTGFRDWYKQNLRWMWGTFQGILGHKIGLRFNKFHLSYVALMFDWFIYIFSGPLTLLIIWHAGLHRLPLSLLVLCGGYSIWVAIAAISLKMPRLLLFVPAVVLVDFLFRIIMIHGLIKALTHRTVEACVWNSPKRFDTRELKA